MGRDAVLLVPHEPVAHDLVGWRYGRAEEASENRKVKHLEGRGDGGGVAYVATVEGIDVYAASGMPSQTSLLLSATALRSVTFAAVPEDHAFVTLRIEEGDDPRMGNLVASFSQSVSWDASPAIEFRLAPDGASTSRN